jgi:hypothetical protein
MTGKAPKTRSTSAALPLTARSSSQNPPRAVEPYFVLSCLILYQEEKTIFAPDRKNPAFFRTFFP